MGLSAMKISDSAQCYVDEMVGASMGVRKGEPHPSKVRAQGCEKRGLYISNARRRSVRLSFEPVSIRREAAESPCASLSDTTMANRDNSAYLGDSRGLERDKNPLKKKK